jgi:hypothetical protein
MENFTDPESYLNALWNAQDIFFLIVLPSSKKCYINTIYISFFVRNDVHVGIK